MKPLIVFSDVTIDGFMAGPDNDLDFMVDDPQLEDELTGMLMSVADTIVAGRKASFSNNVTPPAVALSLAYLGLLSWCA